MLFACIGLALLGAILGLRSRAVWLLVATGATLAGLIIGGIVTGAGPLEIALDCVLAMIALQPAFVLSALLLAPELEAWLARRRSRQASESSDTELFQSRKRTNS